MTSKLPVYELKVAIDRVDEHQDALPEITHIAFLSDRLTFEDVIELTELAGSLDALADIMTDNVLLMKAVRLMLPKMTDFPEECMRKLSGADGLELIKIMNPFLVP